MTPERGYAPTARKPLLAFKHWWPVPAGRIATSPALRLKARPLVPPNCTVQLPRAMPRTSWILEW